MGNDWRIIEGGELLGAKSGNSEGLLICLSGYFGKSYEPLRIVANRLFDDLPNVDILLLKSFDKPFWVTNPLYFVKKHLVTIDRVSAGNNYIDIRFLGFSMGAPVARKILVAAFGAAANSELIEPDLLQPTSSRDWHKRVSRLTFVAGYSRGWIVNPRMALLTRFVVDSIGFIGHFLATLPIRGDAEPFTPTVFALRRGAPFIFNTRMQWLGLMRHPEGPSKDLTIVHLIPTNDDFVSAVEVIDVESDQGNNMFYLPVGNSDHWSVLNVTDTKQTVLHRMTHTKTYQIANAPRYDCLISGIARNASGTRSKAPFITNNGFALDDKVYTIPMQYIDDSLPAAADASVSSFVFIIHGIRDTGAWAKKIGAAMRTLFDSQQTQRSVISKMRTDTQTYGYFAIFPFIWPWVRRQKVEWLMDRYATAKALFPKATMNFVGHSNGTYLAASALRDYHTCKFERVVFAGSVVSRSFDWHTLKKQRKVDTIVNYVATGDVVVAVGPKGLQGLLRGFFDLGSASHDGFDQVSQVGNVKYVVGSHGAGIQEHVWNEIADFIVNGNVPTLRYTSTNRFFSSSQTWWVKALGFASPVLVIILAYFALNLLYGFAEPVFGLWHFTPKAYILNMFGNSFDGFGIRNWFFSAGHWIDNFWQCYNSWSKPVHGSILLGYAYFMYLFLFKW